MGAFCSVASGQLTRYSKVSAGPTEGDETEVIVAAGGYSLWLAIEKRVETCEVVVGKCKSVC